MTEAAARLERWLSAGHHAEMAYMNQPRHDPGRLLDGARSVLVAALPHPRPAERTLPPEHGYVAYYAGGRDYHQVLRDKLWQLGQVCSDVSGRPITARACVDTAPLLERELAIRAGIAVSGKSTLAIVPGAGTYVLLGLLLTDLDIPSPASTLADPCGSCSACLEACPTDAFVAERVLDARRCISYLTIEHRGSIPRELRPRLGQHVFGCDVCQQVCPYNQSRKLPTPAPELERHDEWQQPSLLELLQMGSAEHRRRVKNTAMNRVSRARFQRNAAIALGNSRPPGAISALVKSLSSAQPLVRAHAAWALGQVGGKRAEIALAGALGPEQDAEVRAEIQLALSQLAQPDPHNERQP